MLEEDDEENPMSETVIDRFKDRSQPSTSQHRKYIIVKEIRIG
jgi:hypothetical protein